MDEDGDDTVPAVARVSVGGLWRVGLGCFDGLSVLLSLASPSDMMVEDRQAAIQSRGGWKKRNARPTRARLLARLSRRIRDDVKGRVSLEVLRGIHWTRPPQLYRVRRSAQPDWDKTRSCVADASTYLV